MNVCMTGESKAILTMLLIHSILVADASHTHTHTPSHCLSLSPGAEFKHLVGHAPGGIYMFPHQSDIRTFFGVAFLRKGLYRGGVFRFKLSLPQDYNSAGSYPTVTFTPPIFHPLVDAVVSYCV
jgi:hypothetical protein